MKNLKEFIDSKEVSGLKFKPTSAEYKRMKVGCKRFHQILRGEKSPTIDEIRNIAAFFGVHPYDIFDLSDFNF